MKMSALAILVFAALGLMSCMVVVNEDEGCCDNNPDGDTVTIIFSQAKAGITSPVVINR